jgi:hypothetical protein
MLSQKLIDELRATLAGELQVLEDAQVYIWGAKESTDRGESWIKTTRVDVYRQMLALLDGEPEAPEELEVAESEEEYAEDED